VKALMRAVLSTSIGIAALLATAPPAAAHPLGNFTINRFSGLEVFPKRLIVHYVVDMAEIPTFQEIGRIDTDADDRVTQPELDEYARSLAGELVAGVSLFADGRAVDLRIDDARAGLSAGRGGLDVLRVDLTMAADLEVPDAVIEYEDANYAGRLGWQEIVAYATAGQGIVSSSVPSVSASNELRSYPKDLLSSPIDVDRARFEVAPGAAPAPSNPRATAPEVGPGDLFAGAFASLIERELSPAFFVFAVLLAAAAGALHALGPGHGKTVVAAYLVGTESSLGLAVKVGVAISVMHTASVAVLGIVTLWATNLFPPEAAYPYLSLASGTAVLGLGAWLLWTRLTARAGDHGSSHHHHGHIHAPSDAPHSHGQASRPGQHTHGPASGPAPVSWRGLVTLALSGGLLPSPTALVVLLGAVALHRVAFGVTLVAAFSIGLAGALTLVGMLVLSAKSFTGRHLSRRAASLVPVGSAAAIFAAGLFLTTRAALGF
jgi:nickel/cobalt exporter